MKRFAILGYPLGHTLSPKLHRLLAEQLGEQIEYSICAIPPEELEEHFEELFCMDGFNITIPYKVRLMEQLDRLDTSARNHGAVNVVSIAADGKRCGYNTDCVGFVRTMQSHGVPIAGRVCVLGAGGVGRMFATECALRGCTVTLAVRAASMNAAEQVAAHIRSLDAPAKVEVMDIEQLDGSQAYELMINATPVGMYPNVQHSPVDERALRSVRTLFDCIYNPGTTLLMQQAQQAGCQTIGGMEMLVWQAAAAQEIWFGRSFSDRQVAQVAAKM